MQRHDALTTETTNAKLLLVDELRFVDCRAGVVGEGTTLVRMCRPLALPEEVILWEDATGLAFECQVNWRKDDLVGLLVVAVCDRSRRRVLLDRCALLAA